MYQDLKQWLRFYYSLISLYMVLQLTQPWAIALYQQLMIPGWVQVSQFAISAGLIFPTTKYFNWENRGDVLRLTAGIFISCLAWAASFLP